MEDGPIKGQPHWDESSSQSFIDYGEYFVPDREEQIDTLVSLLSLFSGPIHVLELACGEGRLVEALLERYPQANVTGLDGSPIMLQHAEERLQRFEGRFQLKWFELADSAWRQPGQSFHAILTSLAVHHLNGEKKQVLFRDVFKLLLPGGLFLLGDIVQPASQWGVQLAAQRWDEAVRQRSLQLDGSLEAYHFFSKGWNTFRFPDEMDTPSTLFDQFVWLRSAGFIAVDIFWMKAGHAIFGGEKPAGP